MNKSKAQLKREKKQMYVKALDAATPDNGLPTLDSIEYTVKALRKADGKPEKYSTEALEIYAESLILGTLVRFGKLGINIYDEYEKIKKIHEENS